MTFPIYGKIKFMFQTTSNQYMPRHSECINCAKPDPRVKCFWMVSFSARSSSAQERLPGGCGMLRNVADHLPPNLAESKRTRVKPCKNSMITQEKNGLITTCSQNHGVHNCSTPCSPQPVLRKYPDAFLEEPLKITQVKSLDSTCFIKTLLITRKSPWLDGAWCEQSANIHHRLCAPDSFRTLDDIIFIKDRTYLTKLAPHVTRGCGCH